MLASCTGSLLGNKLGNTNHLHLEAKPHPPDPGRSEKEQGRRSGDEPSPGCSFRPSAQSHRMALERNPETTAFGTWRACPVTCLPHPGDVTSLQGTTEQPEVEPVHLLPIKGQTPEPHGPSPGQPSRELSGWGKTAGFRGFPEARGTGQLQGHGSGGCQELETCAVVSISACW